MKRNALFRITLWSTVLLLLLAILFVLFFAPRSDRRLRDVTPAETMVAIPLPRVISDEDANAIVTDSQNVYSAPDPDADVVAFAERSTLLQILRTEEIGSRQWGYIGSPTLGWIDMNYVEMLEPVVEETAAATEVPSSPDESNRDAVVLSEALNVRTGPSMTSPVAGHVNKGDHLLITRQETVDGFAWGYTPAPVSGWVVMKYVELLEPLAENNTVMDLPAAQEAEIEGYGIILDAASIRDMEIEWAAGTIRIQPKDISEIRIVEEGASQSENPMVWQVRDGKLVIQYAENKKISLGSGIHWEDITKDLIIEVPMNWKCDSMEVIAAAASLEVQDLTIREMEFDGASGTCVFENCTLENLDVDTASGDVSFRGSLGSLDCDAASANILLELSNVPRSLDLDTASGDLNVTLPADAGFTVTMDSLSGDFESDFDTTQRNGSYVAGNGRCRIDVDAMSGDVTVRKGAA